MNKNRVPVDLGQQRILALMFIATGSVFTGIASILGVLRLTEVSTGVPIVSLHIFSVHPYLQILGFLTMFIYGVAYSLIPSLKSRGLPSYAAAKISFALTAAANTGFILTIFTGSAYLIMAITAGSLILEASASLIFLIEISWVLSRGRKRAPDGDGYIFLSAVSLTLAILISLSATLEGRELFSTGFLYLSLAGFVGSMIFGVLLKTVALRFTVHNARIYRAGLSLQAIMVALSSLSFILYGPTLDKLSSLILIASVVLFILSSRSLGQSRLLIPPEMRKSAHKGETRGHLNLLYLEICIISASIWLLFGSLMGALYNFTGYQWIRIAFIHSLGIGFTGSIIIGMSPVLLPGILSRRAPSGNNSFVPLILLNAGLIFFVSGDLVSPASPSLPVWSSIGGPLILSAMFYFMYAIHRNLINKKKNGAEARSFSDDW